MELKIIFDNANEEVISYYSNEVFISTYNHTRINTLLNDNKVKEEELKNKLNEIERIKELKSSEYLSSEFDDELYYEFNDEQEYSKTVDLVNKAINKSFKIEDFSLVSISFKDEPSLYDYIEFLESIDVDLVIDATNLSKENIEVLRVINFKKEPSIKYELNTNLNTLSEFLETLDIIADIESMINSYSLSKLEQLMLLYDLLRKRIYKSGDSNNYASSRDLNKVLKEEEIVCAGYANIFAEVANHLGIPTIAKTYVKINDKIGHATNVSYFYDDFHEQSFILEFDATWNSRTNEEDTEWINDYTYFGQAEKVASSNKINRSLEVSSSVLSRLDELFNNYKFYVENSNTPFIVNPAIKRMFKYIIEIYSYLEDNEKINLLRGYISDIENGKTFDYKFVMAEYLEVHKIHGKGIPLNMFLKSLYRVRRIEHVIDPIIYPLDFKIIESICEKKYKLDKLILKILVNKNVIKDLEVLKYIPADINDIIKYDTHMMRFLHQIRNLAKEKNNITRNSKCP